MLLKISGRGAVLPFAAESESDLLHVLLGLVADAGCWRGHGWYGSSGGGELTMGGSVSMDGCRSRGVVCDKDCCC